MPVELRAEAADYSSIDTAMMTRCVELSAIATDHGEFPFATVIAKEGRIMAETTNRVVRDADITRHAEIIAVSEVQRTLGRDLSDCTLYSNVEPCAMCSFAIRESGIGRVVYAIESPMMGGLSKWNVLRDGEISEVMPEAFGGIPEVIAGLMRREAEQVWQKWNPVAWAIIKHRGCLGSPEDAAHSRHLHAVPRRRSLFRALATLYRMWRSA